MKNSLNIVFFGTPEFSNIVLKKLIDSPYKPSLVITAPDKIIGRKKELTPPPVKALAVKHKINVLQPNKLSAITDQLLQTNPGLFVVAAYGKIIPQEVLDIPRNGTLNIHPSLLPLYRGPSPIQSAILSGDKKTGVTIMLMDEKMDHGPIITKHASKISADDTYEILGNRLFEISANLLIDILPSYIEGKIKPKNQKHKKATYTKMTTREDGLISWHNPANYIERKLRAFTPWPGIYTTWNKKRLKILDLSTTGSPGDPVVAGKVVKYKDGLAVQAGNGFVVPQEVQLEGRKPQSAKEFLNGYPEIIGSTLT